MYDYTITLSYPIFKVEFHHYPYFILLTEYCVPQIWPLPINTALNSISWQLHKHLKQITNDLSLAIVCVLKTCLYKLALQPNSCLHLGKQKH